MHAYTINKTPTHAHIQYSYYPPKQANTKVAHIDRWHPSLHGYLDFLHHAHNLITSMMEGCRTMWSERSKWSHARSSWSERSYLYYHINVVLPLINGFVDVFIWSLWTTIDIITHLPQYKNTHNHYLLVPSCPTSNTLDSTCLAAFLGQLNLAKQVLSFGTLR